MSLEAAHLDISASEAGQMHAFIAELYPICRSITGDGVRKTLSRVGQEIPLNIHEVPTGTHVFDWIVPPEWNITEAWIKDSQGRPVIDFERSNLHVLNYSTPVQSRMPLRELRHHLFSVPDQPDWIPYRTSYYKEAWGFCLTHNQLLSLTDDEYEVCIKASHTQGSLTYGELFLPGSSVDELLISSHICHPSLANDNLSGVTVAVWLAKRLQQRPRRLSYRFLFVPGSIGPLVWMSRNQDVLENIKHGFVLTCVGDRAAFHYKRSRRGDAEVDRAFEHVLQHSCPEFEIMDFSPYGYDERQYCSPGFNLPVGCLMRSVHGTFPEYHTSADDLSFVHGEQLWGTLNVCEQVCDLLDKNVSCLNVFPEGEPHLGKRGLYRSTGGTHPSPEHLAMLWVLNLSDGTHSLLDIADRSKMSFRSICSAAENLRESGLLRSL